MLVPTFMAMDEARRHALRVARRRTAIRRVLSHLSLTIALGATFATVCTGALVLGHTGAFVDAEQATKAVTQQTTTVLVCGSDRDELADGLCGDGVAQNP